MERFVVTIAREYGSGGRIIGEQLAKAMDVPFYDGKMITLTAQESGFSEKIVEKSEHMKTNSLLYGQFMSPSELPISDQVFIAQSQVIKKISQDQSCVIVGRCADYVLSDDAQCIRVFIHAPLEQKVKRVRERYKISEPNLENYIQKQDRAKKAYYEYFTLQKWGSAQNYHLAIDSSIGISTAVHLIKELILTRERNSND